MSVVDYARLVPLSDDEVAEILAEAREKQRRDHITHMESAYLDNHEEGLAKSEAKLITASRRLLRSSSLSRAGIAPVRELFKEYIKRLAAK